MAKPVDSITIAGEYRVSRTSEGLRVEVLDYHADPLDLDRETLRRVGLRFADERGYRRQQGPAGRVLD